ncbi:MAG: hypothetical protein PHI12_12045 [Dehalococcoidales bacterium]|nr:hypothetical protein [Candidatus Omnitrophota bacterium]MDD5511523.1 hypothetical protein [Dehalococcoidales bacterium]
MAIKHRKCDQQKYKKRAQRQVEKHNIRAARRREQERQDHIKWEAWRRDQELILAKEQKEKKELRTRIIKLLFFRMWQMDPGLYNDWSRSCEVNRVLGFWGGRIPFIRNGQKYPFV